MYIYIIIYTTGCPSKKYISNLKVMSIHPTFSFNKYHEIYLYKYNYLKECNFDNYQFFPVMTFMEEIIEL